MNVNNTIAISGLNGKKMDDIKSILYDYFTYEKLTRENLNVAKKIFIFGKKPEYVDRKNVYIHEKSEDTWTIAMFVNRHL